MLLTWGVPSQNVRQKKCSVQDYLPPTKQASQMPHQDEMTARVHMLVRPPPQLVLQQLHLLSLIPILFSFCIFIHSTVKANRELDSTNKTSLRLGVVLPSLQQATGQEFKGTKICGHSISGKGTPLKTSNFGAQFKQQGCHNCHTHLSHKCPTH